MLTVDKYSGMRGCEGGSVAWYPCVDRRKGSVAVGSVVSELLVLGGLGGKRISTFLPSFSSSSCVCRMRGTWRTKRRM